MKHAGGGMDSIANALFMADAIHYRKQKDCLTGRFMVPVYCDVRSLLGYPEYMNLVSDSIAAHIREAYPNTESLVGIASSGIAFAALSARQLNISTGFVRPHSKAYGLSRQIEGLDVSDKLIVLVDDLVSSGGSVISAAGALRDAGAQVSSAVCVMSYGFAETVRHLQDTKLSLHSLTTIGEILDIGTRERWFEPRILDHIRLYLENPHSQQWMRE